MIGHDYPYLDTRDLNLDWLLKNMKQLLQDWATYQQTMNQNFADLQAAVDQFETDVTTAFNNLHDYVEDYFDNLDVQQEINNKLNAMKLSGELAEIMDPLIATQTATWLSTHITNPSNPPIDTSLSVAGAAADAKKTGDGINSVKCRVNTLEDKLVITSSGKTALWLDAGDTIYIDVQSITGQVNAYIEGYSGTLVALTAKGRYIFTAANSGYVIFYFVSTATMTAYITLAEPLSDDVNMLVQEVDELMPAALEYIDTALESGNYSAANGYKLDDSTRLRTTTFIKKNVETFLFSPLYNVCVYAWDSTGAYIGAYTGAGFSTDWHDTLPLLSPLKMETFSAYNYRYALVFRRANGASPSTSELALAAVRGIANNLADTLKLDKSLAIELGTLNTTSGANTASTTAMRTPSYIDSSTRKVTFQNCKARFFAYAQDGTFIGGYGNAGYTKDWTKYTLLDSPVYIDDLNGEGYQFRIVFSEISGAVSKDNINPAAELDLITEFKESLPEEYIVGSGGDFATFTEMLVALKDNVHEKIVYVKSGTYDIFTEMGGAAFMANVDTTKNWREVNNVVPPNTTIIGIGDAILAWNPTDAEIIDQDHAFLFSPLNVSGNCKIQNIKIQCSNCRYGIHDETSGLSGYDGATHVFENVSVVYSASTYGVKYAYGAGHNKNMKLKFKNCLFSAAYSAPWSTHDWPAAANESSLFEFDNCVFKDNRSGDPAVIRFESSDTAGRLDDVKINGCVFSSITLAGPSSGTIKQGYKVTTMLCKAYTPVYSSLIPEADRIAPDDYLIIPATNG